MASGTIPSTQEKTAAASVVARPRAFALACMVAVAAILHIASVLPRLSDRFDAQEHAWVAAHFMMMAHNFAADGVIKLRATPIENNAPQGTQPDVYVHWPPLFPVTLSGAFRLFGESEATARLLMLFIAVAQAASLFLLGRSLVSTRTGLYLAFWWMTFPVTMTFGTNIIHLNLALLFLILSVIAFLRASENDGQAQIRLWAAAGCIAFVLAVLSSWEPILICAGLLVASWLQRKKQMAQLALLYGIVGTLAISAVLTIYLAENPASWGELKETVLFRLGVRDQPPPIQPLHSLVNQWEHQNSPVPNAAQLVERFREYTRMSFGWLAILIAATGSAVLIHRWRREPRMVVGVAALLAAPCAWYMGMPGHVFHHRYEMLLFAPVIALLAAYACERSESFLESRYGASLNVGIASLVGLLMLMSLAPSASLELSPFPRSFQMTYAEAVEHTTPPNAVVITPEGSMVPVYYSHRHLIREVNSDERFNLVLPQIRTIFPGAPVYMAIPFYSTSHFPQALSQYKVVHRDKTLVLLQISDH